MSDQEAPVSLDQRRAAKRVPGLATCTCGSQWWRATVAIEAGRVTGVVHENVMCDECGTTIDPAKLTP